MQKPNIRGSFPAVPGEIVFEIGVGELEVGLVTLGRAAPR